MTPEHPDRDEVLLVRVAHDPDFRAVVMHGPVDDTTRDRMVFASSEGVLDFVRDWLRHQGAPTESPARRT